MKILKTLTAIIALSLFGASYANAGSHAYSGPDLSGEKLTIFGPWLAPQDDDFRDVISIFEAATGASVEYGGLMSLNQLLILTAKQEVQRISLYSLNQD